MKFADINNNSVAEIQSNIYNCADIDLAIFFAPLSYMKQFKWDGFDKESALVIYNEDDYMILSGCIKLQTSISFGNDVYSLYQKMRKFL